MLSRYSHLKYTREPNLSDKVLLSHTLVHMTSFQALKFLEQDRPLSVIPTAGAWFIGAINISDAAGEFVRDSEYFSSEQKAQEALANQSWTQSLDR